MRMKDEEIAKLAASRVTDFLGLGQCLHGAVEGTGPVYGLDPIEGAVEDVISEYHVITATDRAVLQDMVKALLRESFRRNPNRDCCL